MYFIIKKSHRNILNHKTDKRYTILLNVQSAFVFLQLLNSFMAINP